MVRSRRCYHYAINKTGLERIKYLRDKRQQSNDAQAKVASAPQNDANQEKERMMRERAYRAANNIIMCNEFLRYSQNSLSLILARWLESLSIIEYNDLIQYIPREALFSTNYSLIKSFHSEEPRTAEDRESIWVFLLWKKEKENACLVYHSLKVEDEKEMYKRLYEESLKDREWERKLSFSKWNTREMSVPMRYTRSYSPVRRSQLDYFKILAEFTLFHSALMKSGVLVTSSLLRQASPRRDESILARLGVRFYKASLVPVIFTEMVRLAKQEIVLQGVCNRISNSDLAELRGVSNRKVAVGLITDNELFFQKDFMKQWTIIREEPTQAKILIRDRTEALFIFNEEKPEACFGIKINIPLVKSYLQPSTQDNVQEAPNEHAPCEDQLQNATPSARPTI